MMYFTADTHFGHRLIAEKRGFKSVEEMNDRLIANWKARIGEGDEVWVLGDFSFRCGQKVVEEILHDLPGRKRIIWGNHDIRAARGWHSSYVDFTGVLNGVNTHMYHYPLQEWNQYYRNGICLHGHTHGSIPVSDKRIMDVGADCHNLTPISWDEVMAFMKDRVNVPKPTSSAL